MQAMLHFVPYNFPVQAVSPLGQKNTTEGGLLACWFVVWGLVLFFDARNKRIHGFFYVEDQDCPYLGEFFKRWIH